jgi:hypothetical protein
MGNKKGRVFSWFYFFRITEKDNCKGRILSISSRLAFSWNPSVKFSVFSLLWIDEFSKIDYLFRPMRFRHFFTLPWKWWSDYIELRSFSSYSTTLIPGVFKPSAIQRAIFLHRASAKLRDGFCSMVRFRIDRRSSGPSRMLILICRSRPTCCGFGCDSSSETIGQSTSHMFRTDLPSHRAYGPLPLFKGHEIPGSSEQYPNLLQVPLNCYEVHNHLMDRPNISVGKSIAIHQETPWRNRDCVNLPCSGCIVDPLSGQKSLYACQRSGAIVKRWTLGYFAPWWKDRRKGQDMQIGFSHFRSENGKGRSGIEGDW